MVRILSASLIVLCLLAGNARAHYLWVVTSSEGSEHGTAHVYFEEGPRPGDGEYLDPFVKRGKTWQRTLTSAEPTALKMSETKEPGKRWLSGPLSAAAPRSVDSYGKWGVYRYGQKDILLHYYARFVEVKDHDQLHELSRAKQLELDIVPHEADGAMELTVLWRGKPAAGRDVYLLGPGGFKTVAKTNDKGQVQFQPTTAGRYMARTSVEELDQSGEFEEKAYQSIRHNATLTIQLPIGK